MAPEVLVNLKKLYNLTKFYVIKTIIQSRDMFKFYREICLKKPSSPLFAEAPETNYTFLFRYCLKSR